MALRTLAWFLWVIALPAMDIRTTFEGGCLGRIEKVAANHYRLGAKGEADQDGRNRQANWYYFRVDGAPAAELIFDIVDLPGEYNYRPNRGAITADTPPVISYDRKEWKHVENFEYDASEPKLRLRIKPAAAQFWIAHCPPYTNATLHRLRSELAGQPEFGEEIVGQTAGGRDMLLWTIPAPRKGKPTIWLMFRQHSWETGSSWTGEGAVRYLVARTAESARLREQVNWKIFPLCDPDGVARGGVRYNVNGYDLNRNWDSVDAAKMPEIAAQRSAIKAWLDSGHTIDLFLSLHNTETAEYLEGPPDERTHRALAERVFRLLSDDTTFAPTRPLFYAAPTTTAGKPGRMTVSQGLSRDFGIPAFIMEQRVSLHPKLGHLPEVRDRLRFGEELVKALAAAVTIR